MAFDALSEQRSDETATFRPYVGGSTEGQKTPPRTDADVPATGNPQLPHSTQLSSQMAMESN